MKNSKGFAAKTSFVAKAVLALLLLIYICGFQVFAYAEGGGADLSGAAQAGTACDLGASTSQVGTGSDLGDSAVHVTTESDFGQSVTKSFAYKEDGTASDASVTELKNASYELAASTVQLSQPLYVGKGLSVTIDLNGKSLDRNLQSATTHGFAISVEGTLTIQDSAGGGKLTGGNNSNYFFNDAACINIQSGANLILKSGSITGNVGQRGGVANYNGTFNMLGGEISGNVAGVSGGGVYQCSGNFIMSGGTITDNKADGSKSSLKTLNAWGGGVMNSQGAFTMNGGSISGNEAVAGTGFTSFGGGMQSQAYATFTLAGGTIESNKADVGGGINISNTANPGEIKGGKIANNSAARFGGGLFVSEGRTLNLSGAATVSDNAQAGSTKSNIFLDGTESQAAKLVVTGELGDGLQIGVYSVANPAQGNIFASNSTGRALENLSSLKNDLGENLVGGHPSEAANSAAYESVAWVVAPPKPAPNPDPVMSDDSVISYDGEAGAQTGDINFTLLGALLACILFAALCLAAAKLRANKKGANFKNLAGKTFASLLIAALAASPLALTNTGLAAPSVTQVDDTPNPSFYAITEVPARNSDIRVVDFNLRYSDDEKYLEGPDPFEGYESVRFRSSLIKSMIDAYEPDSFGTQEETDDCWHDIMMNKFGDKYGYVGEPRDMDPPEQSAREHNGVFYLKDKFDIAKDADGNDACGTFWLSETPHTKYTKLPNSICYRICTWVALKEKATGRIYIHGNTHLDNGAGEVRDRQATIMMDELDKIAANFPGALVIITGDHNSAQGDNTYKMITQRKDDSKKVAEVTDDGPTAHGFGKDLSIIDYVFVPKGQSVKTYKIIDNMFYEKIYASDHFGLCADINYK